ncbi:MAG: gliding motility protein RemB [Wenyingzhuangia sp.]|uniref:gliding motility protein RemB n=1 Tax=Wenyingzhuangia sp. TaxID=1964193 RepID=UPI00321B149B
MNKIVVYGLLLMASILNAQEIDGLFPEHKSQLRMPFNHASYSVFEQGMYQAENTHTSLKPYLYRNAVGIQNYKAPLLKDKTSWWGRKLWNEHLVAISGTDYWFHLDVLLDVDGGIDNTEVGTTSNNTRILKMEGQIGSQLSYSASVFESQSFFTQFINEYVKINQPEDAYGLIPGRGKSKLFQNKGHDYGISTGYLSYSPNKLINLQFGHGQNFIGDGYRSLFLSDVSAPNTYLKVTTTMGKVQYTNLYMWMKDFNYSVDDVQQGLNYGHKRKYGTFHHLSWNVTSKFNLGLFEGLIVDNSGGSGAFPAEYFNPIIFYKNLEFANGEDSGNGVVGVDAKYRFGENNIFYGQFLLDDFKISEFFNNQNGYWANKHAIQIGVKSFDAFHVKGLQLQAEFNKVTPFTYAHEEQHHYSNFGQSLAHLWGGNFWETVLIARYRKKRWAAQGKLVYGTKGFDIDGDLTSYGGNILISASDRNADYDQRFLQGNQAVILNIDTELSYLVNPSTGFKLFTGVLMRNFTSELPITRIGIKPESIGYTFNTENTRWFVFGVKADLFNHYRDY